MRRRGLACGQRLRCPSGKAGGVPAAVRHEGARLDPRAGAGVRDQWRRPIRRRPGGDAPSRRVEPGGSAVALQPFNRTAHPRK
jgi:hypothetical protein